MAYSKFLEGDKGGKGKSLEVRRMILDSCWLKQLPPVAVEKNKPNPDESVS